MNILHVLPYFPPAKGFGGVPQAVEKLVLAQEKQGINVHVFTTSSRVAPDVCLTEFRQGNLELIKPLENGRVYYYKNQYPFLADQHKFFTPTFRYADIASTIDQPIDVIHFHEVNISGYRSFAMEAIKHQQAVCVSLHGSYAPPTHAGIKKWIHGVIDPVMQAEWFKKCHGYFITSEQEKEKLIQNDIFKEKIFEVPFGKPEIVFEGKFHFQVLNHSIPSVLMLGRINTQKGIDQALQVFLKFIQDQKPLRMLFVGKDEGGVSRIAKFCKRKHIPLFMEQSIDAAGVYVISSIEQSCLYDLFQKVDVTLCASPYESFGLVPLESLVCGTPVVMNKNYGCAKFIQENQAGVYLVADDSRQYTSGIKSALSDQQTIEFEFPSWDDVAQKYIEHYQEMIYNKD